MAELYVIRYWAQLTRDYGLWSTTDAVTKETADTVAAEMNEIGSYHAVVEKAESD